MGVPRRIRRAGVVAVGLIAVAAFVAPVTARAATGGSTWSIVASQDASATDNRLYGVACSAPGTCWAVGTEWNGSVYQTLIEQSSASGFTVVPSPDKSSTSTTNGNQTNVLDSISCLPSGPCFAAGYWYDGQNQAHGLVLENSGGGWTMTMVADSAPAVVDDIFNGITCVSATDCWAVGETVVPGFFGVPFVPIPGTPAQTFTEHWDGTQWKVVSSADSGATENVLENVACTSTSSCYAVGINGTSNSTYDALVEQWNGSAWSIVSAAQPSSQENELDDAWCATDGTCHATGLQRAPSATQTLAETSAGSGWTDDHGADTAPDHLNNTTGIACTDDNDCWAVGEYDSNGIFLFQTLIEQRTAAGWAVVPSPNVSTTQADQLWGVGCADASTCDAVGYSTDSNGANHTLIEALSAPAAQVPESALVPAFAVAGAAVLAVRRRRRLADSPA